MIAFALDGITYPSVLVINIERNFEILDGENAGRVKTGEMVRDVVGTYYNYTMELDAAEASIAEYDALYEALSALVDCHMLRAPYAQTVLEFKAYVTGGKDTLISMESSRNKWGGLTINFIAMAPKRRPA